MAVLLMTQVVIDNHVWLEDPTAYENPKLWASLWTKLVQDIIKDPVTKAAVMFDLVGAGQAKWKKICFCDKANQLLTCLQT